MKKKISNIVYILLLIIFITLYVLSIYFKMKFKFVTTEQVVYSIIYAEGTSFSAIKDGLIYVSTRVALIITVSVILYFLANKLKEKFKLRIRFDKPKKIILLLILSIVSSLSMFKALKIGDYLKMQRINSIIFEEYYVDPKGVKITFPKEKQNLIYIVVESLENTYISNKNGGFNEKTIIPNLENLALDNGNFSNSEKLGGALKMVGTSWTAASLIAQTSAVPLKVQIDSNSYNNSNEFLSGVYSIGEILESNGYSNYFLLGSDAYYGSRKDYFRLHGNYKIMDYNYAKDNGWISNDYHVWWGYEDKKLYEFAKKELTNISKSSQPFNFTMLTADTHFEGGYIDNTCYERYDEHYTNAIYCADNMLNNFINWIKKQDFYSNTTIIITGDHLTMQSDINSIEYGDYDRTVYNTIINSKIPIKNNKNRIFTLFDMYPTTLASLGVEIEGNKLGLGTNLYSKTKTLVEKLGYDYVYNELDKKSLFYDKYLK